MVLILCVHLLTYGAIALLWPPASVVWAAALGGAFIWISIVDFKTLEIPDSGWFLVLAMGLYHHYRAGWLTESAIAAAGWPLFVLIVALVYAQVRGRTGLGLGDVKLLAGIGAWAGLAGTIWVVLAASLSGIAAILTLAMLRGTPLRDASTNLIAFGPFLCLSCWAVVLQEGRL